MIIMPAWKILERHPDGYRTLFHAVAGSRLLPYDEWVRAEIKEGVRDGTSETTYRSGWHFLPTRQDAIEYLTAFRRRLELLKIVEVKVGGEVWPKSHSRSPVFLAEMLYVPKH